MQTLKHLQKTIFPFFSLRSLQFFNTNSVKWSPLLRAEENIGRYIDDYVFIVWTELINDSMVVGLQLATKKSQRIKIFRSEWSVNVTTCWPQKSMWQRRIERYRVLSIILFQSQRVRQWVLNWTFQSMLNQLKLLIIHCLYIDLKSCTPCMGH